MASRINKVIEATRVTEVISKEGDKWVVKSKSGKMLGKHDSKEDALKQLAAVEISKKGEAKSALLTPAVMKAIKEIATDAVDAAAEHATEAMDDHDVLVKAIAGDDDNLREVYEAIMDEVKDLLERTPQ